MRLRTPTDIGLAIRERRRALGLDQATLARRAGVSRLWIVQMEKGKSGAALALVLRTLGALGLALRVDPDQSPPRGVLPGAAVDLDRVVEAHRRARSAPP